MSRTQFEINKAWSDRFTPKIQAIIGCALATKFVKPASFRDDTKFATDLIILTEQISGLRFAARVRKHHYLEKYGWQFTVRKGVPGSDLVEFDKFIAGFGDYFFYGFSDAAESGFALWAIIDLGVFRAKHAAAAPESQVNNDGTSFLAYSYVDFPAALVIAKSGSLPFAPVAASRIVTSPAPPPFAVNTLDSPLGQELAAWFANAVATKSLPAEPYRLWPHVTVACPEKSHAMLAADIARGPDSTRSRSGGLVSHLSRLRELVEGL